MINALPGLAPGALARHPLQGEDRLWVEKNCYTDLWTAVLHGLQLAPEAMLAPTLAVDFEGDQFTFYKPSHDELRTLYGLRVQELTTWQPLLEHAKEHLAQGRLIATESDSHWLPDTAGTDYRQGHAKTTIALAAVDEAAEVAHYFHNTGFHRMEGEDFRQTFRTAAAVPTAPATRWEAPYFAELVHLDRVVHRSPQALAEASLPMLAQSLAWRPVRNPVQAFSERLSATLPDLQAQGLAHYHAWAFATVRQLGSAMELAALYLRWLDAQLGTHHAPAADAFERIAQGQKALILKLARAVNARKPFDVPAALGDMVRDWDQAMAALGN
jgi:Domain of unknown function (DUF1839)